MTPTSTLSSSARRALRAAAHHLDPVVMVGQHGLTPAVLHEIDLALTAHALIKVRVQSDERETREAFLADICAKLGCESVQHLGKLLVLWRNADGAAADDENAEQDAAAVSASRGAKAGRGPRSKLAGERATSVTTRGAPTDDRRRTGPAADGTTRRRFGEPVPPPPRREGWAPKDRRGAARFGEEGGDSRRRDSTGGGQGYGAPRGRAGAGGGQGDGQGFSGRRNDGENRGGSGAGGAGGGYGDNRRSYGQNDSAPRSRWGDRREPAQGGGYSSDRGAGSGAGGRSGQGGFGNGFSDDRGASTPRGPYSRGTGGGADRAPRGGGGGGGYGSASRDNVTGKPSGFSRGPAGGARGGAGRGTGGAAGAPKPRARRRMG